MQKNKTVLLVEDDKDLTAITSFRLKRLGIQIINAFDGKSALAKICSVKPDLILLDINIPLIGGFELCGKINSLEEIKDIPIIFVTASAENIDKKTKECGAAGYLIKPYEHEDMLKVLKKYKII